MRRLVARTGSLERVGSRSSRGSAIPPSRECDPSIEGMRAHAAGTHSQQWTIGSSRREDEGRRAEDAALPTRAWGRTRQRCRPRHVRRCARRGEDVSSRRVDERPRAEDAITPSWDLGTCPSVGTCSARPAARTERAGLPRACRSGCPAAQQKTVSLTPIGGSDGGTPKDGGQDARDAGGAG